MLIPAKTSSPCSVKKSFWGSTGFYIAYKPDWTWIKLRGAPQFSGWRARWDEMMVFSVACWHYKGHIGKLISSRQWKNLRSDVGGCRPGTLLVLRGVHRFTPDSYLPLRKNLSHQPRHVCRIGSPECFLLWLLLVCALNTNMQRVEECTVTMADRLTQRQDNKEDSEASVVDQNQLASSYSRECNQLKIFSSFVFINCLVMVINEWLFFNFKLRLFETCTPARS